MAPSWCGQGDRLIVNAGCLSAVWGHVWWATDDSETGHAGFGCHQGIVADRALMGYIADQRPPDAHRTRLLDHLTHGRHRYDRAEGGIGLQIEHRGRLFEHLHLWSRVHPAFVDIVQIPGDAQDPMRIDPAEIRPDQEFGFDSCIRGRQPARDKNLTRGCFQRSRETTVPRWTA